MIREFYITPQAFKPLRLPFYLLPGKEEQSISGAIPLGLRSIKEWGSRLFISLHQPVNI